MLAKINNILRSPTLFTLMGRMIQLATQIALVLVIPKLLVPDAYVKFSLIMPLGILGASLLFGWMIRAIYRYVHELLAEDDSRCRQTVYFYYGVISLLLVAAYFITSFFTNSFYRLVPILLLAVALKMTALSVLNASEKYRTFFYAHLSFAASLAVFLVLCAKVGAENLEQNLLVYASLDILVAIVIWRYLEILTWPPFSEFDKAMTKRFFLYGLPLVMQEISIWVISLSDRYLLTLWEPSERVASYILSYQLSSSVITIPITFAMLVIFPRAIRLDKESGEQSALDYIYRMLRYYVHYIVLIAILGCAIVIPFKYFVYPAYEFNPVIMIIIVLAHIVSGLSPFLSKEFELNGLTLVISKGMGLGAATNVGLNLAFIPVFGLMGAAVATFMAYGVTVIYLYRARSYKGKIV